MTRRVAKHLKPVTQTSFVSVMMLLLKETVYVGSRQQGSLRKMLKELG